MRLRALLLLYPFYSGFNSERREHTRLPSSYRPSVRRDVRTWMVYTSSPTPPIARERECALPGHIRNMYRALGACTRAPPQRTPPWVMLSLRCYERPPLFKLIRIRNTHSQCTHRESNLCALNMVFRGWGGGGQDEESRART